MTVVDPPSATEPAEPPAPVEAAAGRGGAVLVAAGILSSRLIGVLRNVVLASYFGAGPHMDVLTTAMRAPNFLQNLLGEGTLSAAFIPIYSRLLHEGKREEAGRFAGAIFGLLLATAGALALLGVLLARPITSVLAMGFRDGAGAVDRFELTVQAVRIIFPMTLFLVLSAWALGVLNSHRRFFLPYFAPVVWNAAIIAALVWAGGWGAGGQPSLAALNRLLFAACWGALAGGALQLLVQLPTVLRLLRGFRPSLSPRVAGVKEALGAFGPVLAGRGVVQLAGYLDIFLASFLAAGAVGALGYAQILYLLPISLFGMSVAASELPELSRLGRADASRARELLERVRRSLRQMAVLNVPAFVGYLAFGYLIVALLFRRGVFGAQDNWLVYLVLCGYTLGLLASTSSRLLQNTFYALGETRVPARIAALRVAVSAGLGAALMVWLDRYPVAGLAAEAGTSGEPLYLGAVGLALASGVGAWLELLLLRRSLAGRVEGAVLPAGEMAKMTGLALAAAVPAALAGWWLRGLPLAPRAVLVVGLYAVLYLLLVRLAMPQELDVWIGRFGRRFRRR
ncbi:MAG TPA: murein biosynthesis integral membrane protein MurJ [Thermoanaerobaculia bacterium]|nr:murein biosynthesis integral membrane protein MurJ [Thermoanaerobaculia bacterium]